MTLEVVLLQKGKCWSEHKNVEIDIVWPDLLHWTGRKQCRQTPICRFDIRCNECAMPNYFVKIFLLGGLAGIEVKAEDSCAKEPQIDSPTRQSPKTDRQITSQDWEGRWSRSWDVNFKSIKSIGPNIKIYFKNFKKRYPSLMSILHENKAKQDTKTIIINFVAWMKMKRWCLRFSLNFNNRIEVKSSVCHVLPSFSFRKSKKVE